jgi:hypothetical protein
MVRLQVAALYSMLSMLSMLVIEDSNDDEFAFCDGVDEGESSGFADFPSRILPAVLHSPAFYLFAKCSMFHRTLKTVQGSTQHVQYVELYNPS